AFLVSDFERPPVRGNQIDFQFAVGTVEFRIGRVVGNVVLVTDVGKDIVKNFRKFGDKPRLVEASTSQAGEGVHFVIRLQIVNLRNSAAGHPVGSTCAAPGFAVVAYRPPHTDGENGCVMCGLDLLGDLIEIELTEGVHAGADQNYILTTFYTIDPVQGVVKRVEKVGF